MGQTKPFRGIVQVSGKAVMCKTSVLRRQFLKRNSLHEALLAYFDYLLLQISYLGICNNNHSIENRFSRWLLMMQDRAQSAELRFTQDTIAGILGTRRATISVAAAALQKAGLIRYTPGTIQIPSRKALERAACGCYKIIRSTGR
jgi:CRP-like cAMP-binding protein